MSYDKQDLRLEFEENNFNMNFKTNGVDLQYTQDLETLWQAVVCELMTPFGSVDSERFSNYGSYIHRLIGKKINDFWLKELEFYIQLVVDNYPIDKFDIEVQKKRKAGTITFTLAILKDGIKKEGDVTVGTN
ncbi:MAG: hypothetical protein A4E27_00020 [Methanobacterium sp. PtaU1.Bin242]|nr:MAG: hypothetical protein A4E27_00020 [Methanobacterium sp. PtaU1.Bin242]